MKTEFYLKKREKVEQKRTTRVDKKDKLCGIVKKLQASEENYLKYRSHVCNIDRIYQFWKKHLPERTLN